jgi:hypothetical protein
MNIKLPDGTILTGVPEGTTQEDLMDAIRRLPVNARPGFAQKAAAEQQRERAEVDPTRDMSGPEKAFANIGAGMSNLGQGVQQIAGNLGLGEGVSGDDVAEKRARDEQLARGTTGGKALQIAGEIAPTLVIPAGGFTAAAGRMLPRALAANAARLGTKAAVADAALAGGTYGGLQPITDDESRGRNAAIGAALGSVIPGLAAGANAARRLVTQAGAAERAGAKVAADLGGPQAARAMVNQLEAAGVREAPAVKTYGTRAADSGAAPAIPLSTAATLPESEAAYQLARLEAGSRARNGANWRGFDVEQGRAVADAFKTATAEAEEVAARRAARQANWQQRWAGASEAANPKVFGRRLDDLRGKLDDLATGPESSNPAVRSLVETIQGEMERLGAKFGPGNLQQIRANLAGRANPTSPNAYAAAPRESAAVRDLVGELDDILAETTGGAWDAVRTGYAADSRALDAAKAAGRARDRFFDPTTGRVLGKSLDAAGEVPVITEYWLGGAMNAARAPDKATVLSKGAQGQLDATLDALRRQGIVQRVKGSATAGGGSNTASDMMAAGAADAFAKGAGSGGAVLDALRFVGGKARGIVNDRRDAELAAALQDPQKMLAMLRARLASGEPLTDYEARVIQALQAGAKVPEAGAH